MKSIISFFIFLLLGISLQAQLDYQISNFEMTISGTSTLHDWVADVTTVKGTADLKLANNKLEGVNSLVVNMETKSIKSEKGSMMDKNIYKALNADKYKNIEFKLTQVTGITDASSGNKVNAKGNLKIAGTTQEISLTANATSNNGQLTFEGSKSIKMTDYNVEPPEFMLGAMKTGDEVTIKYKFTLSNSGLTRK